MGKPTILLDGDQYLYQVTTACEVEADWGDDLWTLHTNLKDCKELLSSRVDETLRKLKSPNVIFCISDDSNFRKTVLPSYKEKRKTVRKPLGYRALREWAMEQYPAARYPHLEADDVMGIIATSGNGDCIIDSQDKDMKTIPGKLYRQGERLTISTSEADYWFLYQTLCGDVTDGYKGCPKIGDKNAKKILAPYFNEETYDVPGAWKAVVVAFEKAGLTEVDALQQARVARILRASDWDAVNQTVKLWTP